MIDVKSITRGRQNLAPRVLIYSFEGVGKTKFASGAPEPMFLDLNKGSHFYDVARALPETWSDTLEWAGAVETGKVKCGSLVIDSTTELEQMSHAEFFPGSTVDLWGGGYGKGDTHVLIKWRELLSMLERVWQSGKPIILVAHAVVKKFDDPSGPGYERFEVGVRPKLAGMLRQWVDYVFFAREDVNLTAPPKGSSSSGKATTSGTRWAYTKRCPAFDAKSRGGVLFPEKFLLSWDEFDRCVQSEKQRTKELRESIDAMLTEIQDADLTKAVAEWLKQHPESLLDSHQRVTARLEAHRLSKQAVDGVTASAAAGA